MNVYLTEEEQIEQLKQWGKKYGISIVIGIFFGLVLMYGFQYWQQQKYAHNTKASITYEQFVQHYQEQDLKQAMQEATTLTTAQAGSGYADVAHFFLAQQAVVNADYDNALSHLQKVVTTAAFKQVAALRMARILGEQGHADKALNLLVEPIDPAYAVAVDELRGDLLYSQGKFKDAQQAFSVAIEKEKKDQQAQERLEKKINDLMVYVD